MRYKLIIWIFILVIFNSNGFSQKLKFENYTTEEGLSVGTVWSILQDSRGYLWFGTANGLNKFDGYNFGVYKHINTDSTSLSDNNIYDLLEDENGNIWIATAVGLNKYNPYLNKFERITGNDSILKSTTFVTKSLAIDNKGEIWLGTEYNGLFSYNPSKNQFTNHNTFLFPSNEGDNHIRSIYIDKDQNIWIGTESKGLYKYNNNLKSYKNYRFQKTTNEAWNSLNNNINEIYEDSKGRLWIGTYRGAINQFNKEKESFISYNNKNANTKNQRSRISAFVEDRNGILWAATYGGLSYYNEKKNDFVKFYTPIKNNNQSINSKRLISLYCDNAGSLWIGAYDNGINVIHNTIPKFKHFQKEAENPKSISDNLILSFQKVSKNEYFIGTLSGGLNLFNIETEEFKHLKNTFPELGSPVLSIHLSNLESAWLGTWGNGLLRYNRKNNSIKSYKKNENKNSISNNTVLNIHQSSDSILWLGTFSGLNKFNTQTNTFKIFNTDNGLKSNVIFYITSNLKDTLWIGTKDGGFSEFDIKNEKFNNYLFNENDSNSISNNVVLYINKSDKGKLWLATEKGLNHFNCQTKNFVSYTVEDGLPDNKIYSILEDEKENLWISSDKGLCKFNPNVSLTNHKAFRSFDINDGLQGNEFTQGGSYKDNASGELFFGGTNGFNIFNPENITENQHKPETYITSFKILDKEAKLDTAISFKKHIELTYKQNFLSFEFVGLDYLNPSKNLFQYKMEGLDLNWSVPSDRKYASYPGMKHGEYTFKVRAANNDGIWNNEGVAFKIIIKPPFWQTTWFILSVVIAGILAVLLYIRVRTYRLEQEKKILEDKVAERTEQLRKKNQDIMDSITYAKRIQEAILPKVIEFDKAFENNLVLYKPKDIVSGDFFWFTQKDNTRIFAAADCTGHGVPGAFMSIIGNNLLQKIVNERNIKVPG
jgi:ligand-binding sensor domain-containing protein